MVISLCLFELGTTELDEEDTWGGILSTAMPALSSTTHMMHKATPMWSVFGRDTMLNAMHVANWRFRQENQQNMIQKYQTRESKLTSRLWSTMTKQSNVVPTYTVDHIPSQKFEMTIPLG